MLYKPLLHCNNHLKQLLKVGVVDVHVHVSSHLKKELPWAVDKRTTVALKVTMTDNNQVTIANNYVMVNNFDVMIDKKHVTIYVCDGRRSLCGNRQ